MGFTITSLYISVAAFFVALSRWLFDVFLHFYRRSENIEFHSDKLYEIKIDNELPSFINYEILLLFKNSGRQMGYVILQDVICPDLDPYFDFSVFFKMKDSYDQFERQPRWTRATTVSIDAKSYYWACVSISHKEAQEFDDSSNEFEITSKPLEKDVRKLKPLKLPITAPLTLYYKSTTKKGFKEEQASISLCISQKQTESAIFE